MVHEKTDGNPFFVIQFLYALAEEGLLTFDLGAGRWTWDLDRIHAKGYTDNVVDLMVGKLSGLPLDTQQALQQLACLGNLAGIATLSIVLGAREAQIQAALWEAVRQELVVRLEGAYKFVHDRVQEAAYSLIPEELRAEAHLRMGRLLAAHTPPEKRDEAIFEIVNQLNRGTALITSRDECEQLAELNLIAAKRAKASTAYASALKYLVAGASAFGERLAGSGGMSLPSPWNCSEPNASSSLALWRKPISVWRSCPIAPRRWLNERLSRAYAWTSTPTLGQSDRAVAVCLDYLRYAGIEWAPHPTEEETRREYERIWTTAWEPGNRGSHRLAADGRPGIPRHHGRSD